MKQLIFILISTFVLSTFLSCKKTSIEEPNPATTYDTIPPIDSIRNDTTVNWKLKSFTGKNLKYYSDRGLISEDEWEMISSEISLGSSLSFLGSNLFELKISGQSVDSNVITKKLGYSSIKLNLEGKFIKDQVSPKLTLLDTFRSDQYTFDIIEESKDELVIEGFIRYFYSVNSDGDEYWKEGMMKLSFTK